ncbi:G-protein coupled receptor GRL101-like [Dendronephthya gigantea]|uniref:G-protein coupled receptor GRL101-like n=1 Tax=Dendronephthya gigantea TaxID=151771 RepID=UPI00106C862D|nr:G-protein coupled receptor GRL101-like [Dendronephthya gigantea]
MLTLREQPHCAVVETLKGQADIIEKSGEIHDAPGEFLTLEYFVSVRISDPSDCHPALRCCYIDPKRSRILVEARVTVTTPGYFPSSTFAINLSNNSLVKLQAADWKNLTHLEYLDLSMNMIKRLDHKILSGLQNLKYFDFSSNKIRKIPENTFQHLIYLQYLDLSNNYLDEVPDRTFQPLVSLRYLDISRNRFRKIPNNTFKHLVFLHTLRLSINTFEIIPGNTFQSLVSLRSLDLSSCRIRRIEETAFNNLGNLTALDLSSNPVKSIDSGAFSGLTNLEYLNMSNNYQFETIPANMFQHLVSLRYLNLKYTEIKRIEPGGFSGLRNLISLDLSKHALKYIPNRAFQGLVSLRYLDLTSNKIKKIGRGAFHDLGNLIELNMTYNKVEKIPHETIKELTSLRLLKVDYFNICCIARKINPRLTCDYTETVREGFSNCNELLKNPFLRYSVWIFGLLALVGNLIVVVWRCISQDTNKVNSFFLTNLAVADLLMGVYMLIIAVKGTQWKNTFYLHDKSWRKSTLCVIAGVISTLSSEVSVFTLVMITLDRLVCIVFPFRFQRWSMKIAFVLMAVVWTLGCGICIAMIMYDYEFYDRDNYIPFFGRSTVCIPLQLSSERISGWEFCLFVFLVLNSISFLFILLAYVIMYRTVVKSAKAVRSTRMNQNSSLAKRMMFIILTDFLCWFPVIIISILALTGNLDDPTKTIYVWIAVFVLPINSTINPILYTFSTSDVFMKILTWPFKSTASSNI